jgi:hypothetical protein
MGRLGRQWNNATLGRLFLLTHPILCKKRCQIGMGKIIIFSGS